MVGTQADYDSGKDSAYKVSMAARRVFLLFLLFLPWGRLDETSARVLG